jgi:AcrR family transcriptional regulator
VLPLTGEKRLGRPALTAAQLRQRKQSILDVTLTVVAGQGAGTVRLRDVAQTAGVSIGALQHYFDSRDQLIREAFDQHARYVVETIEKADDPAAEPWPRLVAMFDAVAGKPDFTRRCALWIEFAAAAQHDRQLRDLMDGAYEAWRTMLRAVIDAGVRAKAFQPVLPPDAVVACLLALIDGFELAVTIEACGAKPAAIVEQLTATARVLLGSEPGRPLRLARSPR